jgi:hypothetical protein
VAAGQDAPGHGVRNPVGRSLRVFKQPVTGAGGPVLRGDRAGEEVERLIRTAGFEPVKAGGIEQPGRLEVGGDLHDLVVGPGKARSLTGGA